MGEAKRRKERLTQGLPVEPTKGKSTGLPKDMTLVHVGIPDVVLIPGGPTLGENRAYGMAVAFAKYLPEGDLAEMLSVASQDPGVLLGRFLIQEGLAPPGSQVDIADYDYFYCGLATKWKGHWVPEDDVPPCVQPENRKAVARIMQEIMEEAHGPMLRVAEGIPTVDWRITREDLRGRGRQPKQAIPLERARQIVQLFSE